MKKLLLTGAAAFGLCGGSAMAADMAVKAPVAPVAAYDWSGFYLGIDGGWQGSRIGLSGVFAGVPEALTYAPHHDSFALGGFGGVQRQFGQVVLGIEGGYLSGFNNASLGATPSLSIFSAGGTGTAQAKMRYIWSIGGRAGWALDHWMPYVTGGYANGSFEFDAQNVPPPGTEQAKANTGGGYIGGGVDYAITNNWIIGAEYRHYGFSSKSATGVAPTFTEQVNFAPRTDTVVARLSYKFDWPH